MTINGGQPHAVGDKGQRYEVTYLDADSSRKVLGWTNLIEQAERMGEGVMKHPSWSSPRVEDRWKRPPSFQPPKQGA